MDVIQLLKLHEGFRSTPYFDSVGVLTIGYGQRLDEIEIDEPTAARSLANRLVRIDHELGKFAWYWKLTPIRQSVLMDMAYQLGVAGLLGFTDLIAAITASDFDAARAAMLSSKWARQTPSRAVQLAEMMYSNQWPPQFA